MYVKWFAVAITVFLVVMISGSYVTDHMPKVYTATSQILLRPSPSINEINDENNPVIKGALEAIGSPKTLTPVVEKLGLADRWSSRYPSLFAGKPATQAAVEHLQGALLPRVIRGTNVIAITVASNDSEEAAAIANAIADQYKALRDQEPKASTSLDSPVVIISRAVTPLYPSSPNRNLNFAITLFLAAILATGVATTTVLLSRPRRPLNPPSPLSTVS